MTKILTVAIQGRDQGLSVQGKHALALSASFMLSFSPGWGLLSSHMHLHGSVQHALRGTLH